MRVYVVAPGDTQESIAARDDMAGCKKCSRDLVLANPHRAHVQHPNGYLSFTAPLTPGEQLIVPEKWGDGTLDRLSPQYFDDLPAPPVGLGQLPPDEASQLADFAGRCSRLAERKPTRENHLLAARAHRGAAEAFVRGRGGPIANKYNAWAREHEAAAAAAPAGLGQIPIDTRKDENVNFYPSHWYQQPGTLGQVPSGAPPGPPPGALAPPGAAPPAASPPPGASSSNTPAIEGAAVGAGLGAIIGALGGFAAARTGQMAGILAAVGAVAGGFAGWKLFRLNIGPTGTP